MTTAEIINNKIILHLAWEDRDKVAAIKTVPGWRFIGADKVWTFPASPATAGDLTRILPHVAPGLESLLAVTRATEQAAACKTAEVLPDIPCTKLPARHHQKQGYWFAHDLPATMLAMDMGTGKSKVAIDLVVNRGDKKVLILCPKSVIRDVWPKEFQKHAGMPYNVVPLWKGSVAKKTDAALQALAVQKMDKRPLALVTNYETCWREPFSEMALKQDWDCVILDESHRIKAPGGKASRFCGSLYTRAKHRICLTGTPMPHSPLDVYGQYRFLDPGIFGKSFAAFKRHFAILVNCGDFDKIVGYQNDEELNRKFYSIAYRVGREVLDLPPAIPIERTCILEGEAARVYLEVENNFYSELDAGKITPDNALTKLLRLHQVTSGHVTDDEKNPHRIGTAKPDLLADVLEDLAPEEPVVVFGVFHPDLDIIREVAEAQGRRVGELSGRRDDLQEWKDGEYDVLAVQIQSGGVGIDLTRAQYCVYYSMGFSLGDYKQSLARIHRPGQEKKTFFIYLIAELESKKGPIQTIDGRIYKALEAREEVVNSILKMGRD